MENIPQTNKTRQIAIAALFVTAGLAIQIWPRFLSFLGQDECYQALCVRFYDSQPLAMLSFYIGHLWTCIFGDSVISLRMLMVLCNTTAAGMACFYLWYRLRSIVLSAFMFLLSSLMTDVSFLTIYGWDVGCYAAATAGCIATLEYHRKGKTAQIVVAGVCMALLALCRAPSCVGILIPLAVIYGRRHRGGAWRDLSLYLAVVIATMLIVICIMCGSVQNYIASWIPDNIISGHTDLPLVLRRFNEYIRPILLQYGFVLASAIAACMYFRRTGRKYRLIVLALWLLAQIMIFGVLFCKHKILFYPGIGQCMLLILLWHAWRRGAKASACLIIAACALTVPMGSDRMIQSVLTMPFPAIALAVAGSIPSRRISLFLVLNALTLSGLNCSNMQIHYSDDAPQTSMNGIPHMQHLHQSASRKDYMLKVINEIDSLRSGSETVLFWGNYRYILTFLVDDPKPEAFQVFSDAQRSDSTIVYPKIKQHLGKADYIITVGHTLSPRTLQLLEPFNIRLDDYNGWRYRYRLLNNSQPQDSTKFSPNAY